VDIIRGWGFFLEVVIKKKTISRGQEGEKKHKQRKEEENICKK
jgi:hypothetical protein